MKILHTSDWHIGQIFYGFDRADEHEHVFDGLLEIISEQQPDAMVVCGDIFHNAAPSSRSQEMLVEVMLRIRHAATDMTIVMIAGNHDSGVKLDAMRQLWKVAHINVVGVCHRNGAEIDFSEMIVPVGDKGYIVAVPYFHPANYPKVADDTPVGNRRECFYSALMDTVPDDGRPVVLTGHMAADKADISCHVDMSIGGMACESLDEIGSKYDYLALGHIHLAQCITPRAYYSGSILPVSFGEESYQHSVSIVELNARGDVPAVSTIGLPLRRRLCTIPAAKNGGSLDECYESLQAIADDDECYVRMLIDPATLADSVLPPDALARGLNLVAEKQCRLCEVRVLPRELKADAVSRPTPTEVADVISLDPLLLAGNTYRHRFGEDMSDELKELLESAINDCRLAQDENTTA